MTENKRRTGIITLEEARERFNDYYNKRNITPIGRLRGKFFDAAYQKKERFLLKPGEPGSEKYMLEEGPRTFDMEGVDYFPEDTTFEVEADGKIKRGSSKGATYYKNRADNEPQEDLSPPNLSGRQTSKHIYGPRKKLTNELYSAYFKKQMADRTAETGDLGTRPETSGKNLIDIYWEQSRKGKHSRKNKKIINEINPSGKNMIHFDMTNDMEINIARRYKYIINIENRLIHKWIPRVKKYAEVGNLDYDGYLEMDFIDHIIENYLGEYFTKDSTGDIIATNLEDTIGQSDIEEYDAEFYEYDDLPDNIIVRRLLPNDEGTLIAKGDYDWDSNPATIFIHWDDFLDKYEINIEELEELDADQFDLIMRNAAIPEDDTGSLDSEEVGQEEDEQDEGEQDEGEPEEEEQDEGEQDEGEQDEGEPEEEEQDEEEQDEEEQDEEEQDEEEQDEEEQDEEEQDDEEQDEGEPEEEEQDEEEQDEEEQDEEEQDEEEQDEEEQDEEEQDEEEQDEDDDDGDSDDDESDDDESDDDWMSSGDHEFKLSMDDAEYVLDNANSNISDDYFNSNDMLLRRFIANL